MVLNCKQTLQNRKARLTSINSPLSTKRQNAGEDSCRLDMSVSIMAERIKTENNKEKD